MLTVAERDDGLRILRIESPAEAEPWAPAFAGAYQEIWSEPPYNERFSSEEACAVLTRALRIPDNIVLLAVRDSGLVGGFGFAFPVGSKPDVVREIRGLLPIDRTFYFAELGVMERWRRTGLANQLIALRLGLIDRERYDHVIMRTSALKNATYDMYKKMGFEDTGVYMEVPARRNDGSFRTDRRLFMAKVLDR
ncbi:MAG: GNAT family N-acetyltransferase [Deltaproteobacteria bacterium]|nr:GNAT family N-acetyltransferase [Deltaproteobacteria bacterium]